MCLCLFAHGMQGVLVGPLLIRRKHRQNPFCKSLLYVKIALCWVITQGVVVIPYRPYGTTYRSHLQGSRNTGVNINIFCTERRHVSLFSVEDSQVLASCLLNRGALCSSPCCAVSHVALGCCMIFMKINSHSYVVLTSYFSGT